MSFMLVLQVPVKKKKVKQKKEFNPNFDFSEQVCLSSRDQAGQEF